MATDPEISNILQQLETVKAKDTSEPREVGPGDVGPTLRDPTGAGLVVLQMTEGDMNLWWERVERARQRVKSREDAWDILLDEYMPIVSKSGVAETVKVQAHFRNTHTKLGNLFYRQPELVLTPDDPGPAQNQRPSIIPPQPGQPPPPPARMEDIVSVRQAILKKLLGRDGIKGNRLMDELIFDVLQWAGIGCCKVGYEATLIPVQKPVMGPAPQMGGMTTLGLGPQPMVPQIGPDGKPLMQTEMVPIYEEYYGRRFSPKKALWNDDLRSTRHEEDATWMGMDFYLTKEDAIEKFKLAEGDITGGAEDDRIHKFSGDKNDGLGPKLVHCIEIWPRASRFGRNNPHPKALNQLVLIEGMKTKPAVWRPSPDQTFDQMGKMTPDSLETFPIKVLTIRDLADSCFPPADAAFTNSDIKQMSTWRRQSIRIRDAAIGKYLYDVDAFGPEEVEQLKNGAIGEFIPVEGGGMKEGVDRIFAQTSKVTSTPDDSRGFAGIKQDMNETLGMGSNQAGTETDTVRTATESDQVARAVQSRNEKELTRVVDFYLDVARAIDQLSMRYMTAPTYVEIGGEEGASKVAVWNQNKSASKWIYDIAPDSQLRPDNARDFQMTMQHYNLTAKDQLSNRMYLLKRMARQRGMDPMKATMPPQPPPPPKPEPLKVTLNITPEDLHDPDVQAFFALYGENVAATVAAKEAQPEHGGPADQADVISEHVQSNSGGKQNAPGASNHRAEEPK